MFRYYQTSEFSEWVLAKENNEESPWELADRVKATRVTVLAVSSDPDIPRQAGKELTYSGPLYFDIDHEDLPVALTSAKQLCRKLQDMDVASDDIEIHLSGKKGVHIYINPRVFSKDSQLRSPHLVEAYAKIAHSLWVDGIDFQVYSKAKGRMVRPANALRPDNRYKVRVSLAELEALDSDGYLRMTSAPRPDGAVLNGHIKFADRLAKLFTRALVPTKIDKRVESAPVPSFTDMDGAVPECIQMLADGRKKDTAVEGKSTFNAIAVQLGCWAKAGKPPSPVLESIVSRALRNNASDSGTPDAVRLQKLRATIGYVSSQSRYTFSCGAIRGMLSSKPSCEECPVNKSVEAGMASGGSLKSVFLHQKFNNYYADKDCERLVASFSMQRDCIIINEESQKIESTVMNIVNGLNGQHSKIFDFSEDAWLSKQNFKREISGLDGVAFLGSDNDVVRLRLTLARDDLLSGAEIKQIMKSVTAGVIYRKREGPDDPRDKAHKGRLTYVEKDFSVNDMGIIDSYQLAGNVLAIPQIRHRDFSSRLDYQCNKSFELLTQSNAEKAISYMLPWFFACHLKTHIYQANQRFPLLCVSGVAGTGKNSITKVLMRLIGLTGEAAKWTLEAPNCTRFPFQHALSNTTTIPRVINELNPKSLDQYQYKSVIEILKAAFDSQSVTKGTVGGGDRQGFNASTHSWQVTSPVVTLSEEPITIPAVLQRSLQVELTTEGLRKGRDSFITLEPSADSLAPFGVSLIRNALRTPMKDFIARWDALQLPESVQKSDVQERNKFGYKVILMAYDWAIENLARDGLSPANVSKLEGLKQFFIDDIIGNLEQLAKVSGVTEVDKILKDIALMCQLEQSSAPFFLSEGVHYKVHSGLLYLDTLLTYPKLYIYTGSLRGRSGLAITTEEAFLSVVKSMSYYIGYHPAPDVFPGTGRSMLMLSLEGMANAGIPVEFFIY